MTNNASEELSLSWKRPAGPLKVWQVIESKKQSHNGQPLKFSIQDVPKDRYDDVISHMCQNFARDETICKSFNVVNDPVALEDFRLLWRLAIKQGITVGAFIEDPKGGKPVLAGVNVLYVISEGDKRTMKKLSFKSKMMKDILTLFERMEENSKVEEKYGVKTFMHAVGLSVDPTFRGESLGEHILRVRDSIAREFGIPATVTVFTGDVSWKLAARVGFEILTEEKFSDQRDEDGQPVFPNLKEGSIKLMGKRFL
ncbi:uncharacterized protein LOC105694697 isoform X2 [Orussus abietinus]|nr:uncharacterized protein LOC105694697 isoform X2 [Orussus abietinus]XP_012271022.1 uncharacterized protein LOC105694697 isoform X2 [Orussus abietinus]XP_012271023.1 uncharacterized protein LOC105694697 isoform X2 [Orussus abietinus]XP_012271024.1 uncharacterized protein LOC105694697 isoform X2 [Orussus abietinus]